MRSMSFCLSRRWSGVKALSGFSKFSYGMNLMTPRPKTSELGIVMGGMHFVARISPEKAGCLSVEYQNAVHKHHLNQWSGGKFSVRCSLPI